MRSIELAERGLLPDTLVRLGIRRLLRRRLREVVPATATESARRNHAFREALRTSPVAVLPQRANEQHYELPPAFFEHVLGPRLKYSCAWFEDAHTGLETAEEAMLALTCERAGIEDGMTILDLGCGWGSLALYLASRLPRSHVLAVSNSKLQREYVLTRCAQQGLGNVEVVTRDVNRFEPERRFDRVVSVEMFEHLRNPERLLARIASWLEPGGSLFVHHFAHRSDGYPFEDAGEDDWMARHFFAGGIMPSDDLLLHLQRDLVLEHKWVVGGGHYQRTAEAWLARQDANAAEILPVLARAYGAEAAPLWFQRWRLFFLACAELFGFRDGQEWWVVHARMARRTAR